jgi:hypothetical protein
MNRTRTNRTQRRNPKDDRDDDRPAHGEVRDPRPAEEAGAR